MTATDIHRDAIIIDGHSDVLKAIADGKMRLGERADFPDPQTWQVPPGIGGGAAGSFHFSPHTAYFETIGFYDIPRLLEGGVTAQAMAIFVGEDEFDRALHRALEMAYWLHREAEENADFSVVTTAQAIRDVKAAGKTSGFLTMEGLEALGHDLKMLDIFYRLGLRMASLTHARRNEYADGESQAGDPVTGGLTRLGQRAVRRMNELGIVVDLTHLNLRGMWEALELSDAPVVMSHERSRTMAPGPSRYSADADIKPRAALWEAIAKKGGVVAAIGYSHRDVADFVDFVELLLDVVGPDHVGIGTDFYGVERAPVGFAGMHELPAVTAELTARGRNGETIAGVLGGNFLRVFDAVWA